jgi:hypothetical protein
MGGTRIVRRAPHASWLAVGVVCFTAFMGQLDASIVTLTFPADGAGVWRPAGSWARAAGVRLWPLEMLSSLAENHGSRPGQLARMLRLAPSSVATLTTRCGRRGWSPGPAGPVTGAPPAWT